MTAVVCIGAAVVIVVIAWRKGLLDPVVADESAPDEVLLNDQIVLEHDGVLFPVADIWEAIEVSHVLAQISEWPVLDHEPDEEVAA